MIEIAARIVEIRTECGWRKNTNHTHRRTHGISLVGAACCYCYCSNAAVVHLCGLFNVFYAYHMYTLSSGWACEFIAICQCPTIYISIFHWFFSLSLSVVVVLLSKQQQSIVSNLCILRFWVTDVFYSYSIYSARTKCHFYLLVHWVGQRNNRLLKYFSFFCCCCWTFLFFLPMKKKTNQKKQHTNTQPTKQTMNKTKKSLKKIESRWNRTRKTTAGPTCVHLSIDTNKFWDTKKTKKKRQQRKKSDKSKQTEIIVISDLVDWNFTWAFSAYGKSHHPM